MDINFKIAKNNEQTVLVNNCFLHSSYNPSKEAERFIDSININFLPEFIILIEPALSYCLFALRKKFPETKIGVIRVIKEFKNYNKDYDFFFNCFEDYSNLLESFSQEDLLKTYFITWKSTESLFSNEIGKIQNIISEKINLAKTELITSQFFEKKWLINSINFYKHINKTVSFDSIINKPILIISSGPSLKPLINTIKSFRNDLFIICLSSAISVCDFYNIIPDMYMSTDGGYWAGQHLKKLNKNVPLAIPTEAFCNKYILHNQPILPLIYEDSLLSDFFYNSNINFYKAIRNGTVTGTALQFALSISNKPIFMTGVDMANQKGFQHTQPNELEINNSITDYKLQNKELRHVKSEYSSGSLDIYRKWFDSFNIKSHEIYRIISSPYRKNTLGKIIDITPEEFISKIKKFNINTPVTFNYHTITKKFDKLYDYINLNFNSAEWQHHIFPLDYVSLSHNHENNDLLIKLNKRSNNLFLKIKDILYDK